MGIAQIVVFVSCFAAFGMANPESDMTPGQKVLAEASSFLTAEDRAAFIRQRLVDADIIPDVVDDFTPKYQLEVNFSSIQVDLGGTLDPGKLGDAPSLSLKITFPTRDLCSENRTLITVMTDPDAPSRDKPEWSEFCHGVTTWVRTTVTEDCSMAEASETKSPMPYTPPAPPEKTGKHRYVLLAFAASKPTSNMTWSSERKRWGYAEERHGVRDWARENELELLAANFFFAQNEIQ